MSPRQEPLRHHNGIVVAQIRPLEVPMNLTLKNIPDEVYRRLKAAAEAHRRSLNSEAIVCLEAVLLPRRVAAGERLAAARALRATLPKAGFRARDIDDFKRQGRA